MTTLIGTNPDQIPVNSMLGGMAYQDPGYVSVGNITYSGNLTGGSGVINIGSGQIYKTADGKLGLNTTNPLSLLHLNQGATGEGLRFERTGYDVMDIELSENGLRIRNETDGRTDFLLDGAGNLGFGVTPSSWSASWKGLDLQGGSIASGTATELRLYSNSYYNGTNTLYRNAGFATAYQQSGGQHNWFVAPSGSAGGTVTFSTAMSLDATSLSLNGTGATKLQEGTTAQRPASPQEGMIRKNSSTVKIEAYLNSSWVNLDAGELLSITEYTGSPGVDQSFTLNPRTKSIFVEMVAGGGAGGTVSTATYTAGYASAASYGATGTYCIFRIPPNLLQSTYYYRIGGGGVAGGSNSGDTILSETLAGLTSGVGRILVSGGEAGKNGDTPAPPPVAPLSQASTNRQLARSGNFLNVNLIAHNSGASPRGFNILILGASTHLTVLSPEHHSYALNEYRPAHPTFMQYGGGGKGAHKYQGGYTDGAHNGFQGMIRVYEYA